MPNRKNYFLLLISYRAACSAFCCGFFRRAKRRAYFAASLARFFMLLFVILLMAVTLQSCGLPNALSISGLSPTTPIISKAYSRDLDSGFEIILEIENNYETSNFPDFEGFNIYFNQESEETADILKRLLYIDDRDFEPSTNIIGENLEPIILILESPLPYKFTDKAKDEDYDDDNIDLANREDLQSLDIRQNDDFFILVKAVNDGSESASSESVKVTISDTSLLPNFTVQEGASTNLRREDAFEVTLSNNGGTLLAYIDSSDIGDGDVLTSKNYFTNSEESCYLPIEETSSGFGRPENKYTVEENYMFLYKQTVTVAEDQNPSFRFYRFYVNELRKNGTAITLELCINYEP